MLNPIHSITARVNNKRTEIKTKKAHAFMMELSAAGYTVVKTSKP